MPLPDPGVHLFNPDMAPDSAFVPGELKHLVAGNRATQLVNGRIVNILTNIQQPDTANAGQFLPLTKGKIGIEIEFAEIWYRRIEVKPL